jgi:hypothetical protein
LAVVAVGEQAQERTQRGRGAYAGEQARHRTVPQPVHVLDAVRPAAIPPTSDITFAAGNVPAPSRRLGRHIFSPTSPGRPHRSASRSSGSSPP